MLWTFFMLFMFAWMMGLVLEFRLGAIPLVIVLTTIVAFIKLIRQASFQLKATGRRTRPESSPERLSNSRAVEINRSPVR